MTPQNKDGQPLTGDDSARRPFNPDGGEDEASIENEGSEAARGDQKPLSGGRADHPKGTDDPHKVENLTKAGRDNLDPNAGEE